MRFIWVFQFINTVPYISEAVYYNWVSKFSLAASLIKFEVVIILFSQVIEAAYPNWNRQKECIIPKIPQISTILHFEFKQFQFPIMISFAITVNKIQGLSLKNSGLTFISLYFFHIASCVLGLLCQTIFSYWPLMEKALMLHTCVVYWCWAQIKRRTRICKNIWISLLFKLWMGRVGENQRG